MLVLSVVMDMFFIGLGLCSLIDTLQEKLFEPKDKIELVVINLVILILPIMMLVVLLSN